MIPLALFRHEGDNDDECDSQQGCSKYIFIFPSRETYLRESDEVLLIGKSTKAQNSMKHAEVLNDNRHQMNVPIRRKARSVSPQKRAKSNEHVIDLNV
jgi:hypothetical protein